MGNATSCLEDEWSLQNNIAGLAKVKQPALAFMHHVFPDFPPFNRVAATLVIPTGIGSFGAGAFRFGDDLYNEQILTAGFANTIGITAIGVKVNYVQYYTEGVGTVGVVAASMGGITRLTPHIMVGAHILNMNQPVVDAAKEEHLPTRLTVGLGYKPSDKLILISEVEKDLEYDLTWKTGIEYKPYRKMGFRSGFNMNPHAVFLGAGFAPGRFHLDYAYQWNTRLGSSHQASVVVKFGRP